MKRLFSLLLLIALLCAPVLPAAADVAYMPRDNFLEKHWDDCRYESRWYYANGAAGYVLAHKTPDSKEATPLPNGGKYYISNIYKGEWGVLEYDPDTLANDLDNTSVSGWVKMSDMTADYDNRAFMADHAGELVSETAGLAWDEPDNVFTYKYPGSGVVLEELERGWFGGEDIVFDTLFTDPAGRRWGYCPYLYAHRDFWVCLDDPYNGALPPDENCVTIVTKPPAAPAPAPTEAPKPAEMPAPAEAPGKTVVLTPPADDAALQQAAKDNRGSGPYIAAAGAAAVVVAAAVLIAALRKRKK